MQVFICKRQGRAVVSRPFTLPDGRKGYEPCENWRQVERWAVDELELLKDDRGAGPFVYPCPGRIAAQAIWPETVMQPGLWTGGAA